MSESLLKKEFSKSDVQRARNLVKGHYGDSTKIQVGYQQVCEERHKEGDIWTDSSGKTWTIEDGIKIAVTKLQKARDMVSIPLTCPKCGKPMNTRYDKKMYPIHGMCFDCVIRMEDDLKRAGLYKQYEKDIVSGNIRSFVQELKDRIQMMRSDLDVKITTDEGTVENWGRISTQMIEGLEEWAQMLTDKLD